MVIYVPSEEYINTHKIWLHKLTHRTILLCIQDPKQPLSPGSLGVKKLAPTLCCGSFFSKNMSDDCMYKLQQICQFHQVARSLLKSGL